MGRKGGLFFFPHAVFYKGEGGDDAETQSLAGHRAGDTSGVQLRQQLLRHGARESGRRTGEGTAGSEP